MLLLSRDGDHERSGQPCAAGGQQSLALLFASPTQSGFVRERIEKGVR